MAIPAMPNPNTTYVQQGNGQVYVNWNFVAGATSYSVQRSTNGITYVTVGTPTVNFFLDTTTTPGTLYFYQVASVNVDGTSAYTTPQGIIPTITGIMSLQALGQAALQRADRVGSQFVGLPELNFYVNQAAFELYDLLVTAYEDLYVAQPAYFTTNGSDSFYSLPDGITTFTNISGQSFIPQPFYKLLGVDLGLNTAPNGFVTVRRFNFIDRNKYVFPNTASTLYGVFQLQYRVMGSQIEFIPVPSANQPIRLWYIPRLPTLLQPTDTLDGISGWTQYVIIRAAKYVLDKEESPTEKLDTELVFLQKRIEETAINRDVGQNDSISDVRYSTGFGNWPGGGGPQGYGW